MLSWLLLLATLPLAAWYWSKKNRPAQRFFFTFWAFGLIVTPFSLGLYSTYFWGPYGVVTGTIGSLAYHFHDSAGYYLLLNSGLMSSGDTVQGALRIKSDIANAVIWSLLYGVIGYALDRFRNRKNASKRSA